MDYHCVGSELLQSYEVQGLGGYNYSTSGYVNNAVPGDQQTLLQKACIQM